MMGSIPQQQNKWYPAIRQQAAISATTRHLGTKSPMTIPTPMKNRANPHTRFIDANGTSFFFFLLIYVVTPQMSTPLLEVL